MDLVELSPAIAARHPWEEARARFFQRVLRGAHVLDSAVEVLDVGAGDAWFARQLCDAFPAVSRVACWDTGYDVAVLAAPAFAPSSRLSFSRERPGGSFGLLLALDVVEHVEDDAGFLSTLVRDCLAPGGYALVSVPAWPALFGAHDVALKHHRRYAPAAARALLDGAGLERIASGGLFGAPLVVRAAQVLVERIGGRREAPPHAGEWSAPAPVTALVRAALACDAWLSYAGSRAGLELPGLSWWALCRRTSR